MNVKRPAGETSQGGFTLVELMIVVAIVAILASIAFPSYRQYVIRGHRADAKAAMMDLANREQQLLLANRVYSDKATLEAGGYAPSQEVSDYYGWEVEVPNPDSADPGPTFKITFSPTGGQASDGDLILASDGTKTPTDKWQK